ncbi:hypothetical protein BAE44_0024318 [Dichanthelium oligosanthes]|uniref:Uncharacterized protein n=1 Tax=Dichanthelium oligosanthes TaxID=888268 RepID=A0A1E5UP68_9POAL|nr:hypothetical protein BAE44_0024318 [Dichanthelium oligosanthes]
MGATGFSSRAGDDGHDTYYGNTSEYNDLKSKNQDSEEPTDILSMPTIEQAMKKGENTEAIPNAEQMEKERMAIECIAAWFNEAGIPFNTACLGSFDLMLEAIAKCGPGLRGPSLDELDGILLHRQVLAINDSTETLKKSWALEGCSVLVDLKMDHDGMRVLNFSVHYMNYNDHLTCFRNASKESEESDSKPENQNSEGLIDISIMLTTEQRVKKKEECNKNGPISAQENLGIGGNALFWFGDGLQSGSAFGWNNERKMVVGDEEQFMGWAKSSPGATTLYGKPFMNLDKLFEVYASDLGKVAKAKGPGDQFEVHEELSFTNMTESTQ